MNTTLIKQLVAEANNIDAQNEILMEQNRLARLAEMSKNIEETIGYLDSCTIEELLWATEVLEDLAQQFKSQELISCVERNMCKCSDEEKAQLEMTLCYMKKHM